MQPIKKPHKSNRINSEPSIPQPSLSGGSQPWLHLPAGVWLEDQFPDDQSWRHSEKSVRTPLPHTEKLKPLSHTENLKPLPHTENLKPLPHTENFRSLPQTFSSDPLSVLSLRPLHQTSTSDPSSDLSLSPLAQTLSQTFPSGLSLSIKLPNSLSPLPGRPYTSKKSSSHFAKKSPPLLPPHSFLLTNFLLALHSLSKGHSSPSTSSLYSSLPPVEHSLRSSLPNTPTVECPILKKKTPNVMTWLLPPIFLFLFAPWLNFFFRNFFQPFFHVG